MENRVEFALVSLSPLKFKVLGVFDHHKHEYKQPPVATHAPPALQASYSLAIGEVLTLVHGKFPLDDYKDCNTQQYIFEKEDGTIHEGILDGFTHNCTHEIISLDGQYGIPEIGVIMKMPTYDEIDTGRSITPPPF